MSTIRNDVVAFCGRRMDSTFTNNIIQSHRGLAELTDLSAKLAAGDYIPVLEALWSERDREIRLLTLEANASVHPPLMYELGLAKFAKTPTVETVWLVTLPIFAAANNLMALTAICYKGDVAAPTCGKLWDHYRNSLDLLIQKKMGQTLASICSSMDESLFLAEREKKMQESSEAVLRTLRLPSPAWLRSSLSNDATLEPEDEWDQLRKSAALQRTSSTKLSEPKQNDVVEFCRKRTDADFTKQIIRSKGGLDGLKDLDAKLAAGDYIPVLEALWSERDRNKRLLMLEEKAFTHAPLMFELGLAKFVETPTTETIWLVTLPLFLTASSLISMTLACYKNSSSIPESTKLAKYYADALNQLVKKKMGQTLSLACLFQDQSLLDTEKEKKRLEMAKAVLSASSLPSPAWLQPSLPDAVLEAEKMWDPVRRGIAFGIISENKPKTNDVVEFCSKRTDSDFTTKIISSNRGLDGLDNLEEKLAKGNYIAILTALWSERDREKKLNWLRKHAGLHALLAYELGMAELASKPTSETLAFVTLPQFHKGYLLLTEIAACHKGTEALKKTLSLDNHYKKALNQLLTKKELGSDYKSVLKMHNSLQTNYASDKKLKETKSDLLNSSHLPSPHWLLPSLSTGACLEENPDKARRFFISNFRIQEQPGGLPN